jgi:hypothetical protein
MPRVSRDPDVPVFDFQLNPEKPDLATTTVGIYKNHLNKIAEVSYKESLTDKRKKPIVNSKQLLAKSSRVIDIINEQAKDNRAKKCAMFSAVFYAVGSKNLKRNKKMNAIVEAFRAVYNDDKYQEYKQRKADEDERAGQDD